MNLYLSQIQNKNSILGADRYSPGDELELEFIAGEISDIQDEAEILNTPPKIEGKELQVAKDDINDRLQEMYARSRRVKCPMKRRAIHARIKNLKKHGSLNQQTSPAMQVWWSGLVGLSSVAVTAMLYQASQQKEAQTGIQEIEVDGVVVQTIDDTVISKPSIPYLLKTHKRFYLGEILLFGALYHHFVFGKGK